MDKHSDRPVRTRLIYTTMELCRNIAAGEHGSLELIISTRGGEYPTYFFWPLSARGDLSPDQLLDLGNVVVQNLTETVVTRLTVQPELFTAD